MLTDIEMMLARVRVFGGRAAVDREAPEGPRKHGHCVYCAGPCVGATTHCDMRVFQDAWADKENQDGRK